MRKKKAALLISGLALCIWMTACNHSSAASAAKDTSNASSTESTVEKDAAAAETEAAANVMTKAQVDWETVAPEDVKVDDYKITGGGWYYKGIEDEKYIDMDGLSGFTSYTKEAIPETDGYLKYLGVNPDGNPQFEVYDILGRYFTSMIFVDDEQFYIDGDENEYYVKWDY